MDKIPNELLVNIFACIDSTKALARCRQVSKLWNVLATNAMFNHTVDISSLGRAWKFYDYLLMDASRGELIKSINFGYVGISNLDLKRRILKLVLTQNMKSIHGHHCCIDFYSDMINIIKDNLDGKCNLQTIPHPAVNASSMYEAAANVFEESLREVYLDNELLEGSDDLQDALTYLARFRNLASCSVDLYNADILNTISYITVNLPCIKELTLYTSTTDNSANSLINGLQNPEQQSIIRTIETLRLFTDLEACIKLILAHFDSLKLIELHFEDDINQDFFGEMIDALKTSPHYMFEFTMDDRYVNLQDILQQLPDDVELDSLSTFECEASIPGDVLVEEFTCYLITLKR